MLGMAGGKVGATACSLSVHCRLLALRSRVHLLSSLERVPIKWKTFRVSFLGHVYQVDGTCKGHMALFLIEAAGFPFYGGAGRRRRHSAA